jgi:hypothetical protein
LHSLKVFVIKIKMDIDVLEIVIYLSIGITAYYFLSELAKPKEGAQKWVAYMFVALILLVLAYFAWAYWKKNNKQKGNVATDIDNDDIEYSESSEPESEPTVEFVQGSYKPEKKEFVLLDGATVEDSQIKLENFKNWYLSPEFLNKYTNAIREGLKIKKKRLMEVKTQFTADLGALKRGENKKDNLANLLSRIDKNDESKMLETTLGEINSLLNEVKKREASLSIETTRKGLISAVTDKNNGIDSIIGREDVKDFLILQLFTFAQNPRIFLSGFQNMAIYGTSGLGKTRIAKVIGHVYSKCGILLRDHVHIITKQALTTAFVNESSKMTRKILLANLEGIVFIDEAYSLTPPPTILGNSFDHGVEAITEIVWFVDIMKSLSLVIVAGYEDEMETRFMQSNEGLPRRFPHKMILKSYSSQELTNILIKFILEICRDIKIEKKHGNYIYSVINYLNVNNKDIFSKQAGDMENLSGYIARAIYGTPGKIWPRDSEQLILNGFNTFLAPKNINVEELV